MTPSIRCYFLTFIVTKVHYVCNSVPFPFLLYCLSIFDFLNFLILCAFSAFFIEAPFLTILPKYLFIRDLNFRKEIKYVRFHNACVLKLNYLFTPPTDIPLYWCQKVKFFDCLGCGDFYYKIPVMLIRTVTLIFQQKLKPDLVLKGLLLGGNTLVRMQSEIFPFSARCR